MPHSSGGGSHGGGSHGGSHRSSHGGSRSGGGNGVRMSKRPFANASRYRYRRRGGGYGYIYASRAPEGISLGSFIIQMVFFIPFIIAGVFIVSMVFSTGLSKTKPLTPVYSDSGNYIEDRIGVIDNADYLNETLGEFQEMTGVCPYIITVYDSDWDTNYYSLADYAYDLYVNHFYDEQHFLIVYSEPEATNTNGFVNWSWEGMQGDDTDPIISVSKFTEFQNDLQRYLTMDAYTVGEALNQSFRNSLGYIMENESSGAALYLILFALFWNAFIIIAISSSVISFIRGRRKYEKVPFTEAVSGYSSSDQGYSQNMNQGYNQGYNQNMNQGYNQNMNQGYDTYQNNWNSGANNPYSGNTNRGYNLNGDENGKL